MHKIRRRDGDGSLRAWELPPTASSTLCPVHLLSACPENSGKEEIGGWDPVEGKQTRMNETSIWR